jgi:hypothetical protein
MAPKEKDRSVGPIELTALGYIAHHAYLVHVAPEVLEDDGITARRQHKHLRDHRAWV